jgi:hypothetical protein
MLSYSIIFHISLYSFLECKDFLLLLGKVFEFYSFIQASEYRENKIHTGWLDSRIAMRVRAERPPWYLSVVGGALYVSSTQFVICIFMVKTT